ncbi:ATP-binding protein [Effusibacillus dendaii]|uniref:AAA+ ATPase domain-containing protein n=1 Tax=Effusibacillus dendaii TaxID=2743772 RepID=A0A7I8DGA9_9BACL|nr:MoxR family ATPase [Effusibacillus dendaii]BCJ87620.1 hypothetical protein skT53_26050 [Effusibacillus dendaii]
MFPLPNELQDKIKKRKEKITLQIKGGYLSDDESIFYDAAMSLSLGKNILLKGPTGSGKTKLSESIAAFFHLPVQQVNCSVDLDAEALLGFKTLVNGTIEFVEGPVIKAMKQGHLLYIDEINMAKPETLPILNGILDYRRTIVNPFTQESITAHEDFCVIASINEGYIGTTPLNEALKNRFIVIEVPYVSGEILRKIFIEQSKQKNDDLYDPFISFSKDVIQEVKNGHLSEEAGSIRALIDALDLTLYLPPLRAIKRAIADKLEDEKERELVINLSETYFEGE